MITYFGSELIPSLYDGIPGCGSGTGCAPSSAQDLLLLVANGIRIAMALAGGLAIIVIVVGGIYYVTSSGQPAKIKQARDIMTNAVTGVVIASLGYSIVSFIAGRF